MLQEGWSLGRNMSPTTDTIWIYKDTEKKMINPNNLSVYVNEGWQKGLPKSPTHGKVWIFYPKTSEYSLCETSELSVKLSTGWIKKKWAPVKKGAAWVNNGINNLRILKEEIDAYKSLLKEDMVEPSNLEIFVANADGSDAHQVTSLGNANWSPTFSPKGDKVLFCSNHNSTRGFPFNLFLVNLDGSGLEQVTYDTEFDSFPMFSPNGKYLVFCSNRHNGRTRDTNIFIAEWID
jgi:hypothetical protein